MQDEAPMASIHPFQNLQHPPLDLPQGDPIPPTAVLPCVADDGVEVSGEELEDEDDGVVVVPEAVEEGDDVGTAAEGAQGVALAGGALVVVHLLEGDVEAVGAAAAAVDVGVGAGADAVEDVVLVRDLPAGVDAPPAGAALQRR